MFKEALNVWNPTDCVAGHSLKNVYCHDVTTVFLGAGVTEVNALCRVVGRNRLGFGRDPWVIVWKWLYCLPLVTCYSVMVTSRYMPFRHNYPSWHLFTWPGFTEKEQVKKFYLELFDQIVCLFLTHWLYSHRISFMHNRSWSCFTHCSWNKRKSTLEWHIPCSWNNKTENYFTKYCLIGMEHTLLSLDSWRIMIKAWAVIKVWGGRCNVKWRCDQFHCDASIFLFCSSYRLHIFQSLFWVIEFWNFTDLRYQLN